MRRTFRFLFATVALLFSLGASFAQSEPGEISVRAISISRLLQSMDVEHRWIAGAHVDWQTGLPDDSPELLPGRHTHCSAFVASAAEKLGIYILRPPDHGQVLLANAQNEWLAQEGERAGWTALGGPSEAQAFANRGFLVVASYHNHRNDKPGHIAIVLPGQKSAEELEAEGPDVIQAATLNSASIPLKAGFAGHVHAWADHEIAFYAHAVNRP